MISVLYFEVLRRNRRLQRMEFNGGAKICLLMQFVKHHHSRSGHAWCVSQIRCATFLFQEPANALPGRHLGTRPVDKLTGFLFGRTVLVRRPELAEASAGDLQPLSVHSRSPILQPRATLLLRRPRPRDNLLGPTDG